MNIQYVLLSLCLLLLNHQIGFGQEKESEKLSGKIIRALCQSPDNADLFYIGLKGDTLGAGIVYKSSQSGTTWERLGNKLAINPYVMDIQTIAVTPSQKNILFAGTWKYGLFRSINGGISWTRIGSFPCADVRSFKISPFNPKQLYAGTSSHGVLSSSDGGISWMMCKPQEINKPFNFAWQVVLHPTEENTIFAATFDKGLFKSTDKGRSWTQLLDTKGLVCWDLKISEKGKKMWLATNKDRDSSSVVFHSKDGGKKWEKMEGVPQIGINQINVIEGAKQDIVLVGSWRDGVYIYENGKWTKEKAVDFEAVAEILVTDKKIIIGSWGNGVYTLPNRWRK